MVANGAVLGEIDPVEGVERRGTGERAGVTSRLGKSMSRESRLNLVETHGK